MGAILSHLKTHRKKPCQSTLMGQSISEIKEQWLQFKTRCNDFWIDYEEFHKIFKQDTRVFSQWDTNQNGLIDVLELFSCLIIYSKSVFEDKMRFLFEIFDFNGLFCLTVTDIEYMVNCCVSSILKVNLCHEEFEIEQERISHLVNQSFKSGDIINSSVFLRFCVGTESISEFMRIIQQSVPEKTEMSLIQKIEQSENPNSVMPEHLRHSERPVHPEAAKSSTNNLFFQQLLNTQHSLNRKSFILNFVDRIHNFSKFSSEKHSTLNLKWVFGFRHLDVVHPVVYHNSTQSSGATNEMSEKLVFFSGKIVVLYYYKMNKQLIYNEHANRISALTVSSDSALCASADYGKHPKIHIWSIDSLKTKMTLEVVANSNPYLLKFINKDAYLVVVLKRPFQPLLVYDILMGLIRQTIKIDSFLHDLIPVYSIVPSIDSCNDVVNKHMETNLEKCFFAFSKQEVHLFFFSSKSLKHEMTSVKVELNENDSITGACALFSSTPNPDLKVYTPSHYCDLSIFIGLSNGRLMMINNTSAIDKIKMTEIRNFQSKIKFLVFLKSKLVVVYTENFMLNVVDFVSKKIVNRIPLNSCHHKLDCYEVHHMERVDHKRVILVTQSGEIVWVHLKEKLEWDSGILKPRVKSRVESGVFGFPSHCSVSNLLEINNGEYYLFVYCGDNTLYTISTNQHRIVNKWICPEPVSAMDAFYNKVLGIVNCLGCLTGLLMIRVQWNKILEKFDCKSEVVSVKFSETGKHLLVSLRNCSVLVFQRKNGLYFKEKETRFTIPNETVLNFNFNDKCEQQSDAFVILTTNLKNHYVHLLFRKTPHQPLFVNTVCNNRLSLLGFSAEQNERQTPILLISDPFYLFCGEHSGTLTMFDSVSGFKTNMTGYYNGHSSAVTHLMISNDLSVLYSLCGENGELFQWKVEVENWNLTNETTKITKYFYQGHDSVLNHITAVQNASVLMSRGKEMEILNRNQNFRVKKETQEEINKETRIDDLGNHQHFARKEEKSLNNKNQVKHSSSDLLIASQKVGGHNHQENDSINDLEKPLSNQDERGKAANELPLLKSLDSQQMIEESDNQNITEKHIKKTTMFSSKMKVECDSFAYFRSFNNADLRKVYKNRAPNSNESKDVIKKMHSEYSLKLKYVYGLSAYEFTGMCMYLHTTFEIIPFLSASISSDPSSQQRYPEFNYSKLNHQNDQAIHSKIHKKQRKNDSIQMQTKDIFGEMPSMENTKKVRKIRDSFSEDHLIVKKTKEEQHQQLRREYQSNFPSVLVEKEFREFLNKIQSNVYVGDASRRFTYSRLLSNYGRCHRDYKDCYRQILYVVSRIVVLSDPLQIHQQRFYEGHTAPVSVLIKHPLHNLVATGEIAVNPRIHFWNPTLLMTVSVVITGHQSGILLLEFLNFENAIVSVSTESTNSMQVSDWKTGDCVAYRNTFPKHIVSVKSSPIEQSSFITGSLEQIDWWEMRSRNIVHVKSVSLNSESFHGYINTLTYFHYQCSLQSRLDVLVTSSYGQVGLVGDREYVSLSHKFEKMIVNVVRPLAVNDSVFVFMGCEDGSIRGYTIGFEKVFEWKELDKPASPKIKTHGIQSIDFYLCDADGICLLAMTRHGKIVELELSFQRDVFQHPRFVNKTVQRDAHSNGLSKKEKVLVHSHVAQTVDDSNPSNANFRENKKVFIALNREREIMASVGDDESLFIWDIKTCSPVKKLSLHLTATAIKFGPHNRLIIGFNNGKVKIYDLEFMVSFDLGNVFSVVVKENPFVISDPDIQTGVLNIELSDKGERLAVSYDILRVEHEVENRKKAMEGFAVSVYQLVTKSTGGLFTQDGPYKHFDELRPSILNQFEMSKIIFQNMAVHHMSFSEDFVHLFVYLQKMEQAQLRNVRDQDGQFILRNITTQQIQNLTDNDYLLNFSKVVFPSHVNGVRLSVDLKTNKERRKPVPVFSEVAECVNNKITLSAICDSEKIVIMGSVTGELFLSRSTMFSVGNSNSPNEFRLHEMNQAKTYPAHTSFVNQIETDHSQKYVFSTGIDDECIYQWEIERTEDIPDQEITATVGSLEKFCQDIPNKEHFMDLTRLVHPVRMNITKILLERDRQVVPRIKLNLLKVIGRKALVRRGNLLTSDEDRLIYCTGSVAILIEEFSAQKAFIVKKDIKASELITYDDKVGAQSDELSMANKSEKYAKSTSFGVNQRDNKDFQRDNKDFQRDNKDFKSFAPTSGTRQNAKWSSNQSSFSKPSFVLHSQVQKTLKNVEVSKEHPMMMANETGLPKSRLLSQSFIIPSNDRDLIPPSEISCMELTIDKRTLCIGTSNHVSVLHFYDVPSVSHVGIVILEECKLPVFMRFSVDNKAMFLCGLDSKYTVSVFFIDVRRHSLMAVMNFLYSEPHWIRDGQFHPISNDSFVLVGPCQITAWKYSCNNLSFKQLVTKPFSVDGKKVEFKKQDLKFESVFISVQFIFSNVFVCGSMTGHLFLWRNEICETKALCYSNMPVVVICRSPFKKGEFLTASFKSNVRYFRMVSKSEKTIVLDCLFEIELFSSESALLNAPRVQTQSLELKKDGLMTVGFRNGSVERVQLDVVSLSRVLNKKPKAFEVKEDDSVESVPLIRVCSRHTLMDFFDDKRVLAADFSYDSSLVFCLIEGGVVLMYSVETLQLVKSVSVEGLAFDIVVLELLILVQLSREIVSLDPTSHSANNFISVQEDCLVSFMRVDPSQKMLCIAVKNEKDKFDYVELFRLDVTGVTKLFQSEPQNAKLSMVDFSVDSETFMFQTEDGFLKIFQIGSAKMEDMGEDFEYHAEWHSDGLKISKNLRSILRFYEDVSICDVHRVGENSVIVVDELGVVGSLDQSV